MDTDKLEVVLNPHTAWIIPAKTLSPFSTSSDFIPASFSTLTAILSFMSSSLITRLPPSLSISNSRSFAKDSSVELKASLNRFERRGELDVAANTADSTWRVPRLRIPFWGIPSVVVVGAERSLSFLENLRAEKERDWRRWLRGRRRNTFGSKTNPPYLLVVGGN